MISTNKLQFNDLPQDFSPKSLPDIIKLAKDAYIPETMIYCTNDRKPFLFETDRIIIREFFEDDTESICNLAINRMKSSMKDFDHQWPTSIEECRKVAKYFVDEKIFWAVCLKPKMNLIGMIANNSVDNENILDMGHVWHTDYQDNDLDTEAISLMMQYAFEVLKVDGVRAHNPTSIKKQIAPFETLGAKIVNKDEGSFVNDENGNPITFEACEMLIKIDEWHIIKRANQNPDNYSPKDKPAIISIAENTVKNITYKVIVDKNNNGCYIDNFPILRWGEWKDCTYAGAVTVVLNAIGIDATYEQVMGLSGSAFRIAMRDDWDPSSAMFQIGNVDEQNATKVFGIDKYSITDSKLRDEQVIKSIDKGIPVVACGQRGVPEMTVICAYTNKDNNMKFYGRSYCDNNIDNTLKDEIYTKNNFLLADNYPGEYPEALLWFFDKRCKRLNLKDALRQSLEICNKVFEHKYDGYKYGYSAYKVLIKGLESNDNNYRKKYSDNQQYHIGSLMDARRAAYIYFNKNDNVFESENNEKLLKISQLYKSIFDLLLTAIPYEETTEKFANNLPAVWDKQTRANLAESLKKIIDIEKQIHAVVNEILCYWN